MIIIYMIILGAKVQKIVVTLHHNNKKRYLCKRI